MLRPDETWHRLLQWTYGQTPSERLAAQILYASGFKDIDPIHPLGGRDGGKDALCKKDGQVWAMAVYFPRAQKDFKEIAEKFKKDLAGATKNNAFGIAFVTNQEIAGGERKKLKAEGEKVSPKISVDLFHLERITTLLDAPTMAPVRQQYLYIPVAQDTSISADQQLLTDFLAALPSNGDTLRFLKDQDLGESFPSRGLDILTSINQFWRDAPHEFLDAEVDNQRMKFLEVLDAFLREISQYAHPGHVEGRMDIGMHDYEIRPEMFNLRDKLNELATAVYNEHQALVRIGRRRIT
jgi:hypothetical protein